MEAASSFDRHLACFLAQKGRGALQNHELTLAEQTFSLLSSRVREGHICLDLEEGEILPSPEGMTWPYPEEWKDLLLRSTAVGRPGDYRPLILDDSRLYLHRYWAYEQEAAKRLRDLSRKESRTSPPDDVLRAVERLFPATDAGPDGVNWQRVGVLTALTRPFCVLSGGPGTGKTTTVAGLLYLLLLQNPMSRILLAAPTGKAANRMNEAIRSGVKRVGTRLGGEGDRRALESLNQLQGQTLHRLLGTIPGSPFFRRNRQSPLACDILVVDEASMVDLAMLAKLLDALPASARLVLVGDRHQLASVEAGSVLAEIVEAFPTGRFPESFSRLHASLEGGCSLLTGNSPEDGLVVQLERSWRFEQYPGIGALAKLTNAGTATAEELVSFFLNESTDVSLVPANAGKGSGQILPALVAEGFRKLANAKDGPEALAALDGFRLLAALREGPCGVEGLNRLAKETLGRNQREEARHQNVPILVTSNDYALGLFNGDVGVTRLSDSVLEVLFPSAEGEEPRRFLHALLPQHEEAWCLTVHKSQGSEFDEVVLVLPDRPTPLLTRELVYTGLTRARKRVTIVGDSAVLAAAIQGRIRRASGLAASLRSE